MLLSRNRSSSPWEGVGGRRKWERGKGYIGGRGEGGSRRKEVGRGRGGSRKKEEQEKGLREGVGRRKE